MTRKDDQALSRGGVVGGGANPFAEGTVVESEGEGGGWKSFEDAIDVSCSSSVLATLDSPPHTAAEALASPAAAASKRQVQIQILEKSAHC